MEYAQTPVFEFSLSDAVYGVGSAAAALDGTATVSDGGTVTYDWQSSADGNVWVSTGVTTATFTPPTQTAGVVYYRVIAKNEISSPLGLTPSGTLYPSETLYPYGAGTVFEAQAVSNTAKITVLGATAPVFLSPLVSAQYDIGSAAAALDGTAAAIAGEISYQWQRSESGESWENIAGGNLPLYTPPATAGGVTFYRVTATNTVGAESVSATSNVAQITVFEASAPVFLHPLAGAVYDIGDAVTALDGTATAARGTVSYQWQSSENGSSWENIVGANLALYTPPTDEAGMVYYRVAATNTVGTSSAVALSNAVTITVYEASAPQFLAPLADAEYFMGDAAAALDGTATAARGTITYQWYFSENRTDFSPVAGQTAAIFTPPTNEAGEVFYRVAATNTVGTSTAAADSNAAAITVYGATIPVFSEQPLSEDYIENDPAGPLTVLAEAVRGSISYYWEISYDGADFSPIDGAAGPSYVPSTLSVGEFFYRAVAVNTVGTDQKSAVSDTAKITVVAAQVPVFLNPLLSAVYSYGDVAFPLNGEAEVSDGGQISYSWYMSADGGKTWEQILNANSSQYRPLTVTPGEALYYVVATNTLHNSQRSAQSNTASITIRETRLSENEKFLAYLAAVKKPFVKICRLRFLQPDGTTAFALDNSPRNRRSGAFIQSGSISVNLQNGIRRQASVQLSNLDGAYDYSVNKVWFGQQVALDEGLILPNGEEYYLPQGVFYIQNPQEAVKPGERFATYNLVDKWAYLDGSLFGNLESTYEVELNSNIFSAMESVLKLDRGNGLPVDNVKPIFTEYYNGQTTTLPDGSEISYILTPYTLRIDSESGTYADLILGLSEMLAAWVGYDQTGALRVDASQDDILDTNKPVLWRFDPSETVFLGATYTVKNSEVYNDVIVLGEQLDDYTQPAGRAQNLDPNSDTNVYTSLGRRTKRLSGAGYTNDRQCQDLAVWKLKRLTTLQKEVSIQCQQMFHIYENALVTILRPDKAGSPIERHLVTGFTRPLTQTGSMTINAISVSDFPIATVTSWPEE